MPSVNPKLEKQASTEAVDPIRQAIIVVEHKIRNLEKRKAKLEQYRDIVKNGGELNADQKIAVAKYDEVQQTLEITRDISKAINTIANDAIKQQKKVARKEAAERMQQDITKVREVLLIQDTLMNMCAQGVRDDFLNGTNGAVKLTEEDFQLMDSLYNEVMLKHSRQEADPNFIQQAQKVAEHYVLIVEGKQREVVGTTYSKLKEIITSITQCGYFDQVEASPVEVAVEEVTQVVAEVAISNVDQPEPVNAESEFNNVDKDFSTQSQTESIIPTPIQPCIIPPNIPLSAVGTPFPVPTIPLPVTSDPNYLNMFPAAITQLPQQPPNPLSQSPPAPGVQTQQPLVSPSQQEPCQDIPPQHRSSVSPPKINDVIGPSANFCFLQDSELDHPESSIAVSQTPAVVSHIPPTATVVASAVTLNNAPIPTQTFTNQTFAAPHVVPTPVMYPSQDMSHLPSFGNTNPPPPIPMPPSHQTGLQFGQQNIGGFPQQTQTFEQINQQESIGLPNEELHNNFENVGNEGVISESNVVQNNSSTNWGDATETSGDWAQETSPQSGQDAQKPQSWGEQPRNNFRGRGPRRGNSNGYRGRGNYQQNGRNSYYRSNNEGGGNYQNGYQQQRNWNSNGDGNTGGYNNTGYKSNQPRGPPRGDRNNVDRPNRVGGGVGGGNGGGVGGQFRGPNQRGPNPRPNTYGPRGAKPQN